MIVLNIGVFLVVIVAAVGISYASGYIMGHKSKRKSKKNKVAG